MDQIYTTLQMNDITDEFEQTEVQEQKVLTIVCLIISILFFLPAVSYKDSAYAKTLSNQLFTIFIVNLINTIVVQNIPVVGKIVGTLISLVLFVLIILKIVDAAGGKLRSLPFGQSLNIFK